MKLLLVCLLCVTAPPPTQAPLVFPNPNALYAPCPLGPGNVPKPTWRVS
jgi:hypothetical protein